MVPQIFLPPDSHNIRERRSVDLLSPGAKCDIDLVGTDRIPSACDRICRFSVFYGFRIGNTSVSTEEIVAACVEAINVCVDRINGVMITAFAVFCFMIDRRTDVLLLLRYLSYAGSLSYHPSHSRDRTPDRRTG